MPSKVKQIEADIFFCFNFKQLSDAESALKYRDKQRAKTKLKGKQTAFYIGAVEII